MEKWATVEKAVGETPLQALERFRASRSELEDVPLAYAGRLDPMASGKLLVLIGEECKNQTAYHGLDKEYVFEVLFGVRSDTGDVLGLPEACGHLELVPAHIHAVTKELAGNRELPYPRFSSKTVQGKPLFQWTLEDRLHEIDIPTNRTRLYKVMHKNSFNISKEKLQKTIFKKIDSLPKVTESSKALGRDFRREEVKDSWNTHFANALDIDVYTVATFSCIASSGTYMRTLSEIIAQKLKTCGLALSIHRTRIGTYVPVAGSFGFWRKQY